MAVAVLQYKAQAHWQKSQSQSQYSRIPLVMFTASFQ